ncbi:hypothetical protein [Puia sp.]|jgi:hypothetical protein|uniref:hypothetical protein n=1 Tax=Puia sp. TaxID=2045100 RepID=UPI002F40B7AD
MKNSQWFGIAAVLLVVAACFMPWAYFPDLQKEFTGFFSELNRYGRPGELFVAFGVVEIVFFLIPRLWAKRANIFVSAVSFAWGIKSYILYTACYRGTCPDRRIGIYLILVGTLLVLVASLLPNLPVKEEVSE